MALEISEIAIQMQVDEDAGEETADGEETAGKKKQQGDGGEDGCCGLDKQEIVDECVRRVLNMLKTKRER